MHYSSAVSIYWSLCRTYAAAHYPHINGCFGRAVLRTVELDIENLYEFPKNICKYFLRGIKWAFSESQQNRKFW